MSTGPDVNSLSRRRIVTALSFAPLALSGLRNTAFAAGAASQISADMTQRRLVEGNARYAAGKHLRLDHSARRQATAAGQNPFAIVLGCSDSRVPPEVVFDQGLGDLFTIRVAGNIADDVALGSMEYAVDHFATPLIVVLGHEKCGAVSATVDVARSGAVPGPHISSLVTAIAPAVDATKGMPGDPVENAIHANVLRVVEALKTSQPVLAVAVTAGRLQIVGAEYQLASGKVRFFSS
jgi:carbonic anhydrase